MSGEYYCSGMNELAREIAKWRKRKKFITLWKTIPAKLMLVVTELAEAMEAYRDDNKPHFAEEIADTFIRLLDICGTLKINISDEIYYKMLYNEERPEKHGHKKGV